MSIKSRSFESWQKRKCRAKVKYLSLAAAERIIRLNTTREGKQIFESYNCPWCSYLHLTTRKDIGLPVKLEEMLEKAS